MGTIMAVTKYPNGESYTGEYKMGLKHGPGTIVSWNDKTQHFDKLEV